MKRIKNLAKDESGAIIVAFAIILVIIMSMTALVVDAGIFYYQKSKLQTALDSAALAAARSLPSYNKAQQTAFQYLEKNGISSEGAVVEFPGSDSVRVRKTLRTETFFGKIMDVEALYSGQKAAAKFSEASVSLNFPYLLFQGDPNSIMMMQGQFAINGNIHTNGGIYISGGGLPAGATSPYGDYKSFISGTVTGSSASESYYYVADVWDLGKFYYNWWSNNVKEVIINVPPIQTPDYDSMIMAIAPVYSSAVFNSTSSFPTWSMTSSSSNFFYKMLSSHYGVNVPTNPNTLNYPVPYSIKISNAYSGRNHATVFQESVYFQGGANFNRANTIHGNCYVNGSLNQVGGNTFLDIKGDLYVNGNISLGNSANVDGSIYCTGTFTKGGGSTLTCGGNIYSGGNMNFNGGLNLTNGVVYCGKKFTSMAGNPITVNGVIIAENDMNFGGMPVHLNTDTTTTLSVYSRNGNIVFDGSSAGTTVYGMVYAPKGNVRFGSGNLKFYGNIIAKTINCGSGGLDIGENTRKLPFITSTKTALLIE